MIKIIYLMRLFIMKYLYSFALESENEINKFVKNIHNLRQRFNLYTKILNCRYTD